MFTIAKLTDIVKQEISFSKVSTNISGSMVSQAYERVIFFLLMFINFQK